MSVNLSAPSGFTANDLVFSDSFSGGNLNASSWNTYITSAAAKGYPWNGSANGGSGMNAGGYAVDYYMPSQVSTNNGLTLTAIQQSVQGRPVTSGVVSTYGKMEFDGGYLQISMKQPSGNGSWPGLWLLPGQGSGTADNFEVDIQEGGYKSGSTSPNNIVAYHLHTPDGTVGGNVNTGVDLTSGYNTYAINWVPGKSITWYLNGNQLAQVTSAQVPIPNEPMELIMSNDVAGSAASGWHTVLNSSTPYSMPMQINDVQLYQAAGSGDTIMGSSVGSSSSVPTVKITSAGGTTTDPGQTITGTVDVADAGSMVKVLDGTAQIGSATVGSTGAWSASVTLANQGANVITATDANAAGTETSNAVTYDLVTATPPTVTIADPSLTVLGRGGSVAMGIGETAPSSATAVRLTITGLPKYETISDDLGDRFKGSSVTLSQAQVDSGLTLHSYYEGNGHPVATLHITGSDTIGGVTQTSAPQTITVYDPPPSTRAATDLALLLNQHSAGVFNEEYGGRFAANATGELAQLAQFGGRSALTEARYSPLALWG